jgi:hypothetical protein
MPIGQVGGSAPISAVDASDAKSVLVAAKALQQQKQDGADAMRLIQSASAPGVGQLLNTYA